MYVVLDPAKVRTVRQEKGMSRPDLAARAGIAEKTVRKIERREATIRLSTAKKIGAAFGVHPRDFGRLVER
jgi:ribosome-binding protein aMBF1 (putative translation factor)